MKNHNHKELPRVLDPGRAFNRLANWVAETVKQAPGLVVSLSGTDSALTFLICSKGFEIAGKDPQRLIGIHYGKDYKFKEWLSQFGIVEVTNLPENSRLQTDIYRWAALQSRALKRKFWIVGTRNRTEQLLGDYSNASSVAVMQPLSALWKSEVFLLCEYLNVPEELITASWVGDPDCYCHRPGLMGRLSNCETILAARQGDIEQGIVSEKPFYKDTTRFLELFTKGKTHKNKLPYRPPIDIVDKAVIHST